MTLYDEILEQPAALQRLLDGENKNIAKVATKIKARAPKYIMLAARGSSDNAARYGQYLFSACNRLPVALATPSLFTIYKSPPRIKDALVIAISQSGQSPDICAVIEEGSHQGALTVAVTNDTSSPLAAAADVCIDLRAGPEHSVAASKTYTSSLLAMAMLSTALAGEKSNQNQIASIPDHLFKLLHQSSQIMASAETYRDIVNCVTLGRGYNYSTAFEIALKLKELTYVLAEPYSSADFQHGPVALVQGGFLVLAIVPEGITADELTDLVKTLRRKGAHLYIIGARNETLSLGQNSISIPGTIPEWLSPIAAVVPGQLFALGLAKARGINPDQPRGLTKVTLTR